MALGGQEVARLEAARSRQWSNNWRFAGEQLLSIERVQYFAIICPPKQERAKSKESNPLGTTLDARASNAELWGTFGQLESALRANYKSNTRALCSRVSGQKLARGKRRLEEIRKTGQAF